MKSTSEWQDGMVYVCEDGGTYEIMSIYDGFFGCYCDKNGSHDFMFDVWSGSKEFKTKKGCAKAIERNRTGCWK